MDNEVLVFDDIIDEVYQNKIKSVLICQTRYNDEDFPWYYIDDVTAAGDYENQKRGAFVHDYADYEQGVTSDFHYLFIDLIKKSCSKLKIKEVDVLQGRSFLQLPTNIKREDVDSPHTDMIYKHFVMLYYVCDSDGDTIIYNEKVISEKGLTVQKKVTPKQGRVVLFDGAYYHTAQQPNNNIRCIVNYDLRDLSVDSHI
tara:strand:+ start:52 stop:648 length:597 start_codon:yes stop_codon:yes gene_type:complete